MIRYLLCTMLLIAATSAHPETPPLTYDRIHLSAAADEQVENDIVIAVLYAQAESHDMARASDQVNQLVAAAMKTAKARKLVKARTLEYSTTPLYQSGKPTGQWQVRQAIRLESPDSAALSTLLGELQKTLALRSLSYEISEATRLKVVERLTQRAIEAFKTRARQITQAWDRNRYRLVEMQIGDGGTPPPQPMFQAAEMSVMRSAPAIEAGEQRVSVIVHGTIELLE